MQIVVSPCQGLVLVIMVTQGGAARLAPLHSALGWFVEAPSGRRRSRGDWARSCFLQFTALPAGLIHRAALLDIDIPGDAFQIADDIDGSEDFGGIAHCG